MEYFAALLTSVKDDRDKKPYYLNAARLMGITVLPPDVNGSELDFTPVQGREGAIRYGLGAVRNVGAGAVAQIIEARGAKGPFTSFTDFCGKVDPGVLHKKILESLTVSGAFESLGYARKGLLDSYDKVAGPVLAERRAEAAGQFSLFGGRDDSREIDESVLARDEFAKPELLRREKEVLGQFVTDHPLLEVKDRLAAQVDRDLSELGSLGDGDVVTVGGIVGGVLRRFTRKGDPYVSFRLEDLTGGVQVIAFPSVYEKAPDVFDLDTILLVKGRADLRGRELALVALDVSRPRFDLDDPPPAPRDPIVVTVPAEQCTDGLVGKLKQVLAAHPGTLPVVMRLTTDGDVTKTLRIGNGYAVDGSDVLIAELRTLLGPSAATREPVPVG